MVRKSFLKVLAGAVLITSMLGIAPAGVYAHAGAGPAVAAPCYAQLREDLGTVLPSGWRGDDEEGSCQQAGQDSASSSVRAVSVAARAGAAVLPAGASQCFRAAREDLGTVLPGYGSGLTPAQICAAAAGAAAVAR